MGVGVDVAFKDLCIDVTEGAGRPERVASFWATALGQPAEPAERGSRLRPAAGALPSRTVWINPVPEPPAGKSRVHLDLRVAGGDPAPLVAAGATEVRGPSADDPWWVLVDPDGVALCVFPPHPAAPDELGPFELVVDTGDDPRPIAEWWAARTGGTVKGADGMSWVWVEGAAGFPFRFWVFHPVPEPKAVKNRLHWDVTLGDATVDDLVAAGATLLRAPDGDVRWWVLADPDGNEFCAFEAGR